ncbi:hypothetical protein J3T91_05905 [Bifidobacterium sp. B4001]|uniref:hypothetical protein n=1 Tax=Bifidobacterium TaxID=1678 RepID=UPI001C6A04FC|nr:MULTISPECIES: hypothetical protein [Bifidobacterium]MCX8644132.1 hypothetical protein [Bifidobacterium sp. B4077]MCX8645220.1 hypothetical protein [Bifidobacterium sp. B4081]MCX8646852.1 hypothetical protein [Bifidobacterium sp. B4107]MCX8651037.1 hypothetical protein [Bifidobacterium sp. B4111]MCX8657467.1 hypothetical protein [Bifidobacterium sp. B4114]
MVDQDNRDQGSSQLDNHGEMKADGPDSRPVSSMAIVSLVLGIVALLASFFKEIDLVALCLGGLGVICSLLGFFFARSGGRHKGKVMVIFGLVMSLLAIVIAFFMHGGISQPFVMPTFRF